MNTEPRSIPTQRSSVARFIRNHMRAWGAAYLVAILGITTAFAVTHRQYNNARQQERDYFTQYARDLQGSFQEQINIHISALIGVRGLFDSSKQVDPDEFESYLQSTDILQSNLGLRNIGFAVYSSSQERKPDRTTVKFFIQATESPPLLNGWPCAARAVKHFCKRARDSGLPTGTRRIRVNDFAPTEHDALFLVPVYGHKRGSQPAVLDGYIFAELSLNELLEKLHDEGLSRYLDIAINDRPKPHPDKTDQSDDSLLPSYTAPLSLGGTDWYLQVSPGDGFEYPVNEDRLRLVLASIILITGLLIYIVIVQSRTNRDRKLQTERLEHQVNHDSLTGLPNRYFLHQALKPEQLDRQYVKAFTLCLIDLDGFKEVNDTLGHQAGDQVLCELGPRLRHYLDDGEIVARLGGDEFAIVSYNTHDENGANEYAQRILKAFEDPFDISGITIRVGASIGLARYPEHGTTAGALLRCADVAMYLAKARLSGFFIYDPEYDPHTPRRLSLMTDLQEAIQEDQLVLHFQPILNIDTGEIVCAEALVRWNHPVHGMVPPDEFIPQAENHELIGALTLWVLNKALSQVRRWQDSGISTKVAVNLSARNIQDSDLPLQIAQALLRHRVDPGMLELELTETAVMRDKKRSFDVLSRISELGVKLVIDDFGTGHSSLAYLKTLPVQSFKIDRSFVMDMMSDDNSAVIIRVMIDLAHNIGLTVVAEGIELQDHWDLLEILGCDFGQGYHIARPQPEDNFIAWLHAHMAERKRVRVPELESS
ncbi:diguanylate cyclase/phosphodiesterase (GGDEF & EAL domains) with PAS/PAC sensor(s) [hydrothermal vent metagenome]|uniref:Diguanylate cyclase/phosphodiesterase (GGDEF & EAL domains) with PAS/PAC sensor(S) n=1 Tax=hydrothermal vent metagenome TaxID=652676 RepID=A0A3B0XYD7_9ZZZZ